MKIIYYSILCVILLASCQPKDLPTMINMTPEKVEVRLSHMTTRVELENLATELKEKYNTTMDYSGSTFFEDGKIRDLNLVVSLPNKGGGNLHAPLTNLQYRYYGFTIDFTNKEKVPFVIGSF